MSSRLPVLRGRRPGEPGDRAGELGERLRELGDFRGEPKPRERREAGDSLKESPLTRGEAGVDAPFASSDCNHAAAVSCGCLGGTTWLGSGTG